jgi:hypothetical protein
MRDMNSKHPFFWLANGYIIVGILGGLGMGIMSGPHLAKLMPSLNVTGMIGMCLIFTATMINGFLQQKCKKIEEQRAN